MGTKAWHGCVFGRRKKTKRAKEISRVWYAALSTTAVRGICLCIESMVALKLNNSHGECGRGVSGTGKLLSALLHMEKKTKPGKSVDTPGFVFLV